MRRIIWQGGPNPRMDKTGGSGLRHACHFGPGLNCGPLRRADQGEAGAKDSVSGEDSKGH